LKFIWISKIIKENRKPVHSIGPASAQGFGLAACHGQRTKGLTRLATLARSDCHTAQAGLAARERRERAGRDYRVWCADRGTVADDG
jgi:hypothetical protein